MSYLHTNEAFQLIESRGIVGYIETIDDEPLVVAAFDDDTLTLTPLEDLE